MKPSVVNVRAGRLFSNAVASMVNAVAGSILVFLLYQHLLRSLGAETLGVWSLLIASVSAGRLSELGLSGAATRFIAEAMAREDEPGAARIAETITTTLLALGALGGLVTGLVLPTLLSRFLAGGQLQGALSALPWALGAFVLGLAGGAVQSAFDGLQRMDLRVWVSLAGQLVLVVAAILLASSQGLVGVAIAQLLQALVNLVLGWTLLRRQIPELPAVPMRWNWTTFRRVLGYSALFQLNNLLVMLLDPLVKFLLARIGGLSATAYFELANQFVQRLRQLPVAAAQALVPAMTHADLAGPSQVRELYLRGYRTIFAATLPIFCIAAVFVPAIARIWIGHAEPMFMSMAWICLAGWAISAVGTPAYYANVGIGTLSRNTIGHGLAILVAVLSGFWGDGSGPLGIVGGYSAGILTSSLFVQIGFMQRLHLNASTLVPAESRLLLGTCLATVALGLVADATLTLSAGLPEDGLASHAIRICVLLTICLLFIGTSLWAHPLRLSIVTRLRPLLRRGAHPSQSRRQRPAVTDP